MLPEYRRYEASIHERAQTDLDGLNDTSVRALALQVGQQVVDSYHRKPRNMSEADIRAVGLEHVIRAATRMGLAPRPTWYNSREYDLRADIFRRSPLMIQIDPDREREFQDLHPTYKGGGLYTHYDLPVEINFSDYLQKRFGIRTISEWQEWVAWLYDDPFWLPNSIGDLDAKKEWYVQHEAELPPDWVKRRLGGVLDTVHEVRAALAPLAPQDRDAQLTLGEWLGAPILEHNGWSQRRWAGDLREMIKINTHIDPTEATGIGMNMPPRGRIRMGPGGVPLSEPSPDSADIYEKTDYKRGVHFDHVAPGREYYQYDASRQEIQVMEGFGRWAQRKQMLYPQAREIGYHLYAEHDEDITFGDLTRKIREAFFNPFIAEGERYADLRHFYNAEPIALIHAVINEQDGWSFQLDRMHRTLEQENDLWIVRGITETPLPSGCCNKR